jgi:hypothetical protein
MLPSFGANIHPHRVANEADLVSTSPVLRNHDTSQPLLGCSGSGSVRHCGEGRQAADSETFLPIVAAGLGPSALAIRIQQAVSVQNAITVQHLAKTSRRPNVTSEQRATMPLIDSPN